MRECSNGITCLCIVSFFYDCVNECVVLCVCVFAFAEGEGRKRERERRCKLLRQMYASLCDSAYQ